MATNEQLVNNTDDLEEELRLASVCKNSAQFARVTKHFEFLIIASSLKLGSELDWLGIKEKPAGSSKPAAVSTTTPVDQPDKNILVALDGDNLEIPGFLANSKWGQAFVRFYYSKRALRFKSALVLYVTGKLLLISYLCFYYHKEATGTGAQVRPFVNFKCTTIEHSDATREGSSADDTIGNWLLRAGVMIASWPGGATIIYGVIGFLPVVFYILPHILIRLYQFRVDPLCFLLDPIGQRRRVRNDVNAIINELMLAAATEPSVYHNRDSDDDTQNDCSEHDDENDDTDLLNSTNQRHFVQLKHSFRPRDRFDRRQPGTGDTATTSAANDRLDRIHYIQMLHQIRNLNLVQPYNFSSDWHGKAVRGCLSFTDRGIFFGWIAQVLFVMFYILYEFHLRTDYNLKVIECGRQWEATNRLPAANRTASQLLDEVNDQYRAALVAHDGTLLDRIYLVLFFETKRYLTPLSVLLYIELNIVTLLASFWNGLFQCVFLLGVMDKVAWLKQIKLQLHNSLRITLPQQRHRHHHHHQHHTKHELGVEPDADSALKSLTISYLNYELYRRQNGHFQATTNLFGRQVAALTGFTFFLAYIIAVNMRVEHTSPTLISLVGIVTLMNVYLVASSYRFRQTQKIMNMIVCLLSRGAAAQMPSCDYALKLWRRQLLTETELRQFFASNLFGISVSYQKFILCNAYLVAIIYITLNGPNEIRV